MAQLAASSPKVAVIRAGFCSWAMAYELGQRGIRATLLESDGEVGGLASRIRLGLLALWVRGIRNWRRLEEVAAADWLRKLGGERAYHVVWAPLLQGKFGDLAEEVAAV